jgi:hypothetical protein
MDYAIVKDEPAGDAIPIVVLKDQDMKVIMAHPIICKGRSREESVQDVIDSLKNLGDQRFIFKSDQELAIVDLYNAVVESKEFDIIPERSPVKDSKANGQIENAVQKVEEECRVIRLSLEYRINAKIPVAHPVNLWIIGHAADCTTKFLVGKDGMTAYRRLKGKACREEHLEFGEYIMYKTRKGQVGKYAPQWRDAIWLGKRLGTG